MNPPTQTFEVLDKSRYVEMNYYGAGMVPELSAEVRSRIQSQSCLSPASTMLNP